MNSESAITRLSFFGDSICVGQFIPPHLTWVTRIGQTLTEQWHERIQITNVSVNGNTTRLALERMPSDIQKYDLDVILIQFGMNDCNYWQTDRGHPRVSSGGFKANLKEIITRSTLFGAKKIILSTNHPTTRVHQFEYADISYQQSNQAYNQLIRDVAIEVGTILIDNERIWFEEINLGASLDELLLPDQLHLSQKGHALYFDTACPVIQEIVGELISC